MCAISLSLARVQTPSVGRPLTLVTIATILPRAAASSEAAAERAFEEFDRLRDVVISSNACGLPGVDIKYDSFLSCMWAATRAGFVKEDHAKFVAEGLRWGFTFGVDPAVLRGQRIFKNYDSALAARGAVTRATMKRVKAGRTLCLGLWSPELLRILRKRFADFFIFPMGAVAKPLEPGEARPMSDHTRTGFNAATDFTLLRHTLTTYKDVAAFLQRGYFMYVSDVEAAFPMLPIHPRLWMFFLFRFFADDAHTSQSLFVHLTGDFGAAGLPGTFKIFFVDVVVQMARYALVLNLPMPVYVDDMALIASDGALADGEMRAFQLWAARVCGVAFKQLKDRVAAQCQLYLGLWWDSVTLTRTLDESKLVAYLSLLDDFARASSLTLRERREVAGKMQRAVLTLPPGAACLLAAIFALMAGLVLPWQRRRTTKEERSDYRLLASLLRMNMGRGFYRYDDFAEGVALALSDASKQSDYTGGGYVTRGICNTYHYWRYGGRASRKTIMIHEGDASLKCASDNGYLWRGLMVDFGVDNSSFKGAAAKGYSKCWEATVICKQWFVIMLRHCFLVRWFWLSSKDNLLADHLSRGREEAFIRDAEATGFWHTGATQDAYVHRHPEAGTVRTYEGFAHMACVDSHVASSAWDPEMHGVYGAAVTPPLLPPDAPPGDVRPVHRAHVPQPRWGAAGRAFFMMCAVLSCSEVSAVGGTSAVSAQAMSVPYSRSMLFDGLPTELVPRLQDVLDVRLSASSMRSVNSALRHWRVVAERYDWPALIETDDRVRGAKLVSFVLALMDDGDLVYSSISNYVWGLRQWHFLQHQADPVMGVANWGTFMQAVQVLTWVPHEPRRALPLEVIQRILEDTDESSWQDVCFNLFLLILLFTFSRSECPCPKTFNGFDLEHHWQVRDLQWVCIEGLWCLAVRFKAIKQDPRVVRPEARGDGDWSYVGDVPGSVFSILRWLKAFMSFFADARGPDEPFFLNKDRTKPYTYGAAMADLRSRCARVGVDGSLYGLHGARVTGYNENLGPSGEDVVVAHGGWSDAANASRYRRFSLVRDIIPMASRMLEAFAKRMAQGVDPPHEASGDEAEPSASATAP